MVFSRHVTKQRSDWPELFGMARTKESAQIPDHLFRGHFVSGSGGLGTRLCLLDRPFLSAPPGRLLGRSGWLD